MLRVCVLYRKTQPTCCPPLFDDDDDDDAAADACPFPFPFPFFQPPDPPLRLNARSNAVQSSNTFRVYWWK